MIVNSIIGVVVLTLSLASTGEAPKKKHAQSEPEPAKKTSIPVTDGLDREGLEKRFRETLTEAVFRGSWQMTNEEGLKGKAALGEPAVDKYTISKVTKVAGDRWLIFARIEYGETDVSIPVPVRVIWAEDTPVITVNDLTIPGGGTYSARVMIHGNFYCGTWFGDCFGGVMSGQIINKAAVDSKAEDETQ